MDDMKYLQYPSRRELAISQNPLVITNEFQNLSLPPFISYLLELSLGKPTKRGKKPQNKTENQMGSSACVLQEKTRQVRGTMSTRWAQTCMPGLISLLHIMAWSLKTQDTNGTHLIAEWYGETRRSCFSESLQHCRVSELIFNLKRSHFQLCFS